MASKSGKPPLSLSFQFQTPDILCTFFPDTLYNLKSSWKYYLCGWRQKTGYCVKVGVVICTTLKLSKTIFPLILKVKEKLIVKENYFSGVQGALSRLGSQDILQPVMNSAQAFERGRDQSYGVISAPKCWLNPYLSENPIT